MSTNWQNHSQDYSKVYDLMANIPYIVDLRKRHIAVLKEADIILDAGCGTGLITKELAQSNKSVFGIDNDKNMLSQAIPKLGSFKNTHVLYADLYKIPFPDNSFDGYLSNNVIHTIKEPEKLFSELIRVTKQGATISIAAARPGFDMELLIREAYRFFEAQRLTEQQMRALDKFIEQNRKLMAKVHTVYEPDEVAEILTKDYGCQEILEAGTMYLEQGFFVVARR